jgi:hypothetical protein
MRKKMTSAVVIGISVCTAFFLQSRSPNARRIHVPQTIVVGTDGIVLSSLFVGSLPDPRYDLHPSVEGGNTCSGSASLSPLQRIKQWIMPTVEAQSGCTVTQCGGMYAVEATYSCGDGTCGTYARAEIGQFSHGPRQNGIWQNGSTGCGQPNCSSAQCIVLICDNGKCPTDNDCPEFGLCAMGSDCVGVCCVPHCGANGTYCGVTGCAQGSYCDSNSCCQQCGGDVPTLNNTICHQRSRRARI